MSTRFVLGGARSGKSRFAVDTIQSRRRVVFVATAQASDADMAARIARHRAERPSTWTTIEEPFDLPARLTDLPFRTEAVIVDCLTLWVANLQLRGDGGETILAAGRRLASVIPTVLADLTIVSNEVGQGIHPETAAGLAFRDLLGQINQLVAAACDTVVLLVAGIPLVVKSQEAPRAIAPQAP